MYVVAYILFTKIELFCDNLILVQLFRCFDFFFLFLCSSSRDTSNCNMHNTTLTSRQYTDDLVIAGTGPNYKKILRLSYDVIITYDNRKSNLR